MARLARNTQKAASTLVEKRESAVRARLQATLQKIDKKSGKENAPSGSGGSPASRSSALWMGLRGARAPKAIF